MKSVAFIVRVNHINYQIKQRIDYENRINRKPKAYY